MPSMGPTPHEDIMRFPTPYYSRRITDLVIKRGVEHATVILTLTGQ